MTTREGIVPTRCNIGPDEIARRRRTAASLTAAAALVVLGLVVAHVAMPARFLVTWPLVAAAAVTWLQVVHRFCVAFGAAGIENFGRLGGAIPVDPRTRSTDRRRAAQLVFEGGLIGLVIAVGVAAIPA